MLDISDTTSMIWRAVLIDEAQSGSVKVENSYHDGGTHWQCGEYVVRHHLRRSRSCKTVALNQDRVIGLAARPVDPLRTSINISTAFPPGCYVYRVISAGGIIDNQDSVIHSTREQSTVA